MTREQQNIILKLYKKGYNNRKISILTKINSKTVGCFLKKLELKPHGTIPKSPKYIGKKDIKCSKCNNIKYVDEFLLCKKNTKYEYRLSYCNSCRRVQLLKNINSDKFKVLRDIYLRTKARCKKFNIKFDISFEEIKFIYNSQKGICFYSSIKLILNRGNGHNWNSCTIDKVCPKKGYIKNNIVLCTRKYNTVKNDLSLKEIKTHMPNWYKKLKKCKWLKL
jgi:hypothetical protein